MCKHGLVFCWLPVKTVLEGLTRIAKLVRCDAAQVMCVLFLLTNFIPSELQSGKQYITPHFV